MPELTYTLHILSCFLAVAICIKKYEWRYLAGLLFFVNAIGVVYYTYYEFGGMEYLHEIARLRSLVQVLGLFSFSLALLLNKDKP